MFLKKVMLKFCPISPLRFLVLLEIDFVIKMDLQKTCKKIWKWGENIGSISIRIKPKNRFIFQKIIETNS
jgi:hypothetical protein